MAKPPVHCRICRKKIYREKETGWIMPSVNYFYHEACYNGWVANQGNLYAEGTDEEWFDALYYYLTNVVKIPLNFMKVQSQWKNLLKQKKTAKGIYFAIRYFYDVLRGDKEKALGGIGIVSSIYADSCAHWYKREEKDKDICARLSKQILKQARQERVVIRQTQKRSMRHKIISLDEINEMEE